MRISNGSDKDAVTAQVLRARKGDAAAQEQVAARAYTSGLRLATFSLGDPDLAQDVGQEVAIRVLGGLPKLRDAERFDAWTYRICAREVKRAAKKRQQQAWRLSEESELESEVEAVFPESVGERDWLMKALSRLSERQRLVLGLHYVHGLDDKEIASVIRARRGTVRSLLSRALARLRREAELEDGRDRAPARAVAPQTKEGIR